MSDDALMAEIADLNAQISEIDSGNAELEAAAGAAARLEGLHSEVAELNESLKMAGTEEAEAQKKLTAAEKNLLSVRADKAQIQENVAGVLTDLKRMVDEKLALTVDAPEVSGVDPICVVDEVSDIAQGREAESKNLTRIVRELEAVISLQKDYIKHREGESEDFVAEKRKERSEMIKDLVFQFQDQRNQIHSSIAEVIKVNSEQAANLQRGHVEKRRDPCSFTPDKTKSSAGRSSAVARPGVGPRKTLPRQAAKPTDDELFLSRKNKEVEEDIARVTTKIHEAQKTRIEMLRMKKVATTQQNRGGERKIAELRNIEARAVYELTKVKQLELENSRASELVLQLSVTLKQTKASVERVRGNAIALPTEEDEDGEMLGSQSGGSPARIEARRNSIEPEVDAVENGNAMDNGNGVVKSPGSTASKNSRKANS